MLTISTILKHYKRQDIRDEIIKAAKDREIAVKFGDKGFGKRPDALSYPNDVLELAKQGATSFHASEELWNNPLNLALDMKKSDILSLRKGWDLVLDIDCPVWELSKITTWLIIEALKKHKIKNISLKFSGNKGFHIGVPFEVFPEKIDNIETKNLFPELPRAISQYILDDIGKEFVFVENNIVNFGNKYKIDIKKLEEMTGKKPEELTYFVCESCGKKSKKIEQINYDYICPNCSSAITQEKKEIIECKKCKMIMQRVEHIEKKCCQKSHIIKRFDPFSIIDVDTILISSRHLFRMPYSLHEKSGLCSVPIFPDEILKFSKENAKPENVKVRTTFLDKTSAEKSSYLIEKAYEFLKKQEKDEESGEKKEYIAPEQAVPEQFFPPCIACILKGIEDGRKRSVFVMLNFLTSLGWEYDKIENLLREWNKKNQEPLREQVIVGQLRYHKQNKKKVLPPNCANRMYYLDIGVCKPDAMCKKIKNPVNYSLIKTKMNSK